MEVASIDGFLADPAKVWDFYAKRIDVLQEAQPNDGHRALAELEERGIVRAVITQNVDRLHERAGTRELVEVHGSLRNANCLNCGNVVPFEDVVPLLPVPECPRCGRVLKPGVVMFGELLDPRAMARALAFAVGARRAARRRLVARGASGRGAAGGDDRRRRRTRDRQPRRDAVRRPRVGSHRRPVRARRCARSRTR